MAEEPRNMRVAGQAFCSFCGRLSGEALALAVSPKGACLCDSCWGAVGEAFARQESERCGRGVTPEGVYAHLKYEAEKVGRAWLEERVRLARTSEVVEIRGKPEGKSVVG